MCIREYQSQAKMGLAERRGEWGIWKREGSPFTIVLEAADKWVVRDYRQKVRIRPGVGSISHVESQVDDDALIQPGNTRAGKVIHHR